MGGSLFTWRTSNTHLKGMDRVLFASFRSALGLLRTVPIPNLLSEAGIHHSLLSRTVCAQQSSLKFSRWSKSPTFAKLESLNDNSNSAKKINPDKIGLMSSLRVTEGIRNMLLKT